MRWFLNLKAGLDAAGIPYRVNDYRSLRRSPSAVACVVGKPHVIEKIPAGHPIIYGPGVASHPYESHFWGRSDIRLILIPCEWFKQMYDRDLPVKIPTAVWPAGVETGKWQPEAASREQGAATMEAEGVIPASQGALWVVEKKRSGLLKGRLFGEEQKKKFDFLIYDKVRWEYERYERELIEPIREEFRRRGLSFREIRYGYYEEENFRRRLRECRAMVFLCEHETQGFAYLQALSCGVPILAWNRGGHWKDPAYYPHKVKFGPVSSVPYWDEWCGVKFTGIGEFDQKLEEFIHRLNAGQFAPRDYVIKNLELADKAREYLKLVQRVQAEAGSKIYLKKLPGSQHEKSAQQQLLS